MKKYKINISEEPHCNELESIGSIFRPLITNAISSEDLLSVDIVLKWQDIVGATISSYSRPLKVKYNIKENIRILHIEVPVGGFALEMQHKKVYILEKINAYFGYKAINDMKIEQNAMFKFVNTAQRKNIKKSVQLSDDESKYLDEIVSTIADEKLRENLIKVGKNILMSNKEINDDNV